LSAKKSKLVLPEILWQAVNLLKQVTMNTFKIGTTEFGIGKIDFEIDRKKSIITELVISGDEDVFEKLSEDEDGEWSWALYAPEIYLRGIPFKETNGTISFTVDEDFLGEHEAALYMMEHGDFFAEVNINNKVVKIKGRADIMGDEMDLEIEAAYAG
jgi:hypothetical protein